MTQKSTKNIHLEFHHKHHILHYHQDLSEKENCNQKNGQREPQISMTSPVIKPENSETEVKGNETTGIGDIYILKEYKLEFQL
ncbi:hypothetical protein [Plasmodium yoelii yoelii]|uniref:Uncharacterized protein n=1 Tax=Plasmodium yoelii yoelii TaxID=73239 RepID=Q7RMD2_PLAYO|nr:hypothetical protein [Plasmodium yoelii yoelii]